MKLLLILLSGLVPLLASAQLDTAYYGRYTDNKDLTGFTIYTLDNEMEGYCFGVAHEIYDETGMAVYTEIGLARCAAEDGRFSVEMEQSDNPFFWLTFATDQFGNKTVVMSLENKPDESFFFNPPYIELDMVDPYAVTIDEETAANQTWTSYVHENGNEVIIILEAGAITEFRILSAYDEQCPSPDIHGPLELTSKKRNTYNYKIDGCAIVTLKIEEQQVTVTEKKCGNVHPSICRSWNGVYKLKND
jgi:hypothetical protein